MSIDRLDRNTREQIEIVLSAACTALDQMCENLTDRGIAMSVAPPACFLAFCAPSQLLKQKPQEQLRYVNAGMRVVGDILGQRGAAQRYGKGRKCAPVTKEMAQIALTNAKEAIDATNLVMNRTAARDTLLYKALLEFCAVAVILSPAGLGEAMSMSNELVAEILQSGWLTRNEIKIKG